jgi:hypothetical protein
MRTTLDSVSALVVGLYFHGDLKRYVKDEKNVRVALPSGGRFPNDVFDLRVEAWVPTA